MTHPPRQTTPHADPTNVDTTRKQRPDDPGAQGKLPHERDQSIDMTDPKVHPEMKKAYDDLRQGQEDTDARGTDGRPKRRGPGQV